MTANAERREWMIRGAEAALVAWSIFEDEESDLEQHEIDAERQKEAARIR